LEDLIEYYFQGIKEPLDRILEIPSREYFHPPFEGGGKEPPITHLNTLCSHHSHQYSLHNSHPNYPMKMPHNQP
jgi:hypothetical protein